ncbi:MAG: phosphosulfolactate synthase, partial [Bacillota bacterium]
MDLHPPIGAPALKPRQHGLTTALDKGTGLRGLSSLLETAGDWIGVL